MSLSEDIKEAEFKTVRGIRVFQFPIPGPESPDYREAVLYNNDWRWRHSGSLLAYEEYAAIEAEWERRSFEKELQDEEICRKVGI